MGWSSDWPQQTGFYFFYGWRSRDHSSPAIYHLVAVKHIGSGPIYIADGHLMYLSEGGVGLWHEISLPIIPNGMRALLETMR